MESSGPKIHSLAAETSHRVSTSQVIASLAGALRELIDNSIDSGATQIGKQHCTSKLSSIDDFNSLTSFGFRGEGLNALASLSDLQVTTRCADSRCGTKLSFDRNGEIINNEQCPRQVGTTVLVSQLFAPLPVRRQELERRARSEFLKLLECVQCYALSHTKIRFSCSNIIGSKNVRMLSSLGGNTSVKDVISTIFGGEKGSTVLELQDSLPNDEVKLMYGLKEDSKLQRIFNEIRISGYVSTCDFNQGRSSSDRQFVYVNRRPVDFSRICRIANEVYNIFNRGRYCMLVLFIDVPPSTLDVNVTPDKRTVFLYHEKEVFAKLRATLLATFSSRQGNCPTSSISSNSTDNRKRLHKPLIQWKNSDGTIQIDQQQAYISSTQLSDESDHLRIFDDSLECNHLVDDVQSNNSNGDIEETITTNSDSFMEEENSEKSKHTAIHQPISRIGHKIDDPDLQQTPNKRKKGSEKSDAVSRSSIRNSVMKTLEAYSFQRLKSDAMNSASKALQTPNIELEPILKSSQSIEVANEIIYDERPHAESQLTVDDKNEFDFPANTSQMCEDSSQSNFSTFRPQQVITLDFESLQENFLTRYGEQRQTDETQLPVTIATSGDMIGDEQGPDKAIAEEAKKQAEQHLSLLLKKSDFQLMQVVGQFNDAFIITLLGSQMFIIDQHAADEKYNFERLQSNARVDSQPLIHPQPLELGAVNEAVLVDNVEILRTNGFDFVVEENAAPGKRVQLKSVPTLKKWNFNKDDIDELVASLSECPGVMHRPSKLRKIFASNACRKSVMFGDPLSVQKMEENCPHGRPTIRHLCEMQPSK